MEIDMHIRYECEGAATAAEHLNQLLDTFDPDNGLDWKKRVGNFTDGNRAVTGSYSSPAARIREDLKYVGHIAAFITRQVKKTAGELKSGLYLAVK